MAEEKQFAIQKIYVKDVSFETPNSPDIFREKWEPGVEFNLSSSATPLAEENLFEVVLTVTVTVKLGDKTAYLVEVAQAGIFAIQGFAQEEMGPLLGIYCPNVLFPYAREVVSDLSLKGGFMPMVLPPVNFEAIYAQKMQQEAQQQAASKPN
ncbi:preprotein translocase subunit SecB [Methylomarinovum caldicuralii]|uniref:Protein-export protein SecB n=1 Tax=Methylomarinovum caldicuralii TaxID=438856 RepID=A0AAU9CDE7_9GAMM|nr:protein-export chaperone SecB [Methylomarinovum caldicuralii]BCX82654.1 preprotein translocase subunit SecB [Methylomarinovum caldicuralii]